jgi:hypothetical protein
VTEGPTEQFGVEVRQRAGVRRFDSGSPPHTVRSRAHALKPVAAAQPSQSGLVAYLDDERAGWCAVGPRRMPYVNDSLAFV